MLLLLCGRTEADGDLRYAPDKWTLKEVLGHVNDTERIMSYRALRISRGDGLPSKATSRTTMSAMVRSHAVRWLT